MNIRLAECRASLDNRRVHLLHEYLKNLFALETLVLVKRQWADLPHRCSNGSGRVEIYCLNFNRTMANEEWGSAFRGTLLIFGRPILA